MSAWSNLVPGAQEKRGAWYLMSRAWRFRSKGVQGWLVRVGDFSRVLQKIGEPDDKVRLQVHTPLENHKLSTHPGFLIFCIVRDKSPTLTNHPWTWKVTHVILDTRLSLFSRVRCKRSGSLGTRLGMICSFFRNSMNHHNIRYSLHK